MGIAASKDGKKKKKKDSSSNKKKKKPLLKNGKRSKNSGDADETKEEPDLIDVDAKPEAVRKKIIKLAKTIAEKRDKLKPQVKQLLAEKRGLQSLLDAEREKLMGFIEQKSVLEEERGALMQICWSADADELYRCFETRDVKQEITIFASRTKWQLIEIGKIFQDKYRDTLQSRLVTENQNVIGKLFTGTLSHLVKLLVYRIMPQNERDAAFLRDFTSGISIQDENILEIVMTRSNAELKAALDWFVEEYDIEFSSTLQRHSYKNYRDFMMQVLECNRDEFNEPFDDETATALAEEVFKAGAGRTIGMDAQVFIKTFANINKEQFESLNAKYKDKALVKDITSKLGGDFALAVKIRCTDKYEYLASRLASTLRSTFSADKELVCRIFGCCARWEGPKIRDAYDKGGHGRSLEAALKAHCGSEPNFLRALTLLISGDLTNSPLGSDRELGEDEAEATRAGRRARQAAVEAYSKKSTISKGTVKAKAKAKTTALGSIFGDADDEDIPQFEMLSVYRGSDIVDLTKGLRKAEAMQTVIDNFKETVKDEISSLKESLWAITAHCYESETWLSILKHHIKSLKAFNSNRSK